ncbi:MAG TPA: hypothetical protein VE993_01560 [Stellaceae bacterium]|nr:hypothetical protein [Stellaceae bacterium]
MCDIGGAIARAFTPPGTGGLIAQQEAAQQDATASSDAASAALTKAISDATKASLPVLDNPSALAANRDQMRKLLATTGAAWSFGNTPAVAPTVATKVLLGA